MKSVIIYYSQTGNTRKVARAIHRGMGQLVDQCDFFSVREAESLDLGQYDLIGLGSPIWMGGIRYSVRSPAVKRWWTRSSRVT